MHVAKVNKYQGFSTIGQLKENKEKKAVDVAVVHTLKQPTGVAQFFMIFGTIVKVI